MEMQVGRTVTLKESSMWDDAYVELEKIPSRIMGFISLEEVSNKPLFSTNSKDKVVVLDRKVPNAPYHHNGFAIVHEQDLQPVGLIQKVSFLLNLNKKRLM